MTAPEPADQARAEVVLSSAVLDALHAAHHRPGSITMMDLAESVAEALGLFLAARDAERAAEVEAANVHAIECERIGVKAIEDRIVAEATVARMAEAVSTLPARTEGPLRAGTDLWPECDRDAYSLAIEEAQTVLRAVLDGERP